MTASAPQSRAGWTAPRVLVGKGRRVSTDVVIAHHNSAPAQDREECETQGDSASLLEVARGVEKATSIRKYPPDNLTLNWNR